MTALSRSMDPRTLCSASRFCGGRRSAPAGSTGMATSCRSGETGPGGRRAVRGPPAAGTRLPLPGRLWDDHDPHLGLDVVPEGQPDGPLAEVPDRLLQLDHGRVDEQVLAPHPAGDL